MTDIYKWLFGKRGKAAMSDMASSATMSLPDVLAPFAAKIRATELPYIEVGFAAADAPRATPQSQLGGTPWWPEDVPYPKGITGNPLFLLAQFNLDELPALPALPLPRQGLLQFFIGNDDLYGCNVENVLAPTGFRTVLHTDLKPQPMSHFEFLHRDWAERQMLPFDDPFAATSLAFASGRMPVDASDYRFERLLPEIAADEALTEAYFEWKSQELDISAIRIGGYPTFTQDDPRKWRDHDKYKHYAGIGDVALLTVDTTDGMMWGDSGAAQFLAHQKDIAKGDVSQVIYNWDCL